MLYLAADHRGFRLKQVLKSWLDAGNYQFQDLGNQHFDPQDDYPDFARLVAQAVSAKPRAKGVVVCGSGVGVDVVANKFPGVRSGLALSPKQIRMARSDDDINVLALAADFLDEAEALEILRVFLTTEFSNQPRHQRRLDKISEIEKALGLQ